MSRLTVVLVGIGGYGSGYVDQLLYESHREVEIAGAVDPYPENYSGLDRLKVENIPVYHSLEAFYAEHKADLAVISSPIHFHCPQSTLALAQGSHVLCEKPIAATVQEALQMLEARDRARKLVGIGYQWSFSDPILALKQDIIEGKLGEPQLLKTLVLWPRNQAYYARGWAGRLKAEDGSWILDSVANNAAAHHLHNMFFVLGDAVDTSAGLKYVEAEVYRANQIESFDTCMVRGEAGNGAEILFYASHAAKESLGPIFEYRFSDAVVRYNESSSEPGIVAKYNDGTWKSYGNPKLEPRRKLWVMIDAILNNDTVPCGIEAAMTQTVCINGIHESRPEITWFPKQLIKHDPESDTIYADHLGDLMVHLYQSERLPSDEGISWSQPGQLIRLEHYRSFPQ
ncbi:MAG: Gfo/Idh/MocA family oxidoreductase [Firmicutes bacterium]|nr:Gfo/Idh/MocA family oxidoreductase [Bacillota bacterium]HKM16733.1 Gfo/Idh/MocA family oxidoreductase [Limnochordia bacterium]